MQVLTTVSDCKLCLAITATICAGGMHGVPNWRWWNGIPWHPVTPYPLDVAMKNQNGYVSLFQYARVNLITSLCISNCGKSTATLRQQLLWEVIVYDWLMRLLPHTLLAAHYRGLVLMSVGTNRYHQLCWVWSLAEVVNSTPHRIKTPGPIDKNLSRWSGRRRDPLCHIWFRSMHGSLRGKICPFSTIIRFYLFSSPSLAQPTGQTP